MSDWAEHAVAHVDDLDDPGAVGFLAGDGDWPFRGFVVRRHGDIMAFANICPHARHPLDMLPDAFLTQDGSMIRCASHGALFRPDDGECVAGPCVGAKLLRLDARVDEQGKVFVRAPDSLRDETLSGWNGL